MRASSVNQRIPPRDVVKVTRIQDRSVIIVRVVPLALIAMRLPGMNRWHKDLEALVAFYDFPAVEITEDEIS